MIGTISQLIAQIESSNNPHALRFEPQFNPTAENIAAACHSNACSTATGKMICATSWGLYQIMGENLYSLGFKSSIFDFINSPSLQLVYFNEFLASRKLGAITLEDLRTDQTKREYFASRYNGAAYPYANVILNNLGS